MLVQTPLTVIRMELLGPLTFRLTQTKLTQFTILQKLVQNAKVRNTFGFKIQTKAIQLQFHLICLFFLVSFVNNV